MNKHTTKELRFNYNPFTETFYDSTGRLHALTLRSAGQAHNFDSYIRGIISDGILYLRTYYPYKGIETLTYTDLNKKSGALLALYRKDVVKAVKKHYRGVKVKTVIYNADNDLFKRKGLGII